MITFLEKHWLFVILGIVLLAGAAAVVTLPSSTDQEEPDIFYEEIPGSSYHSPDGTWWGHNMSKIVRDRDTVYTYVVHNDDDPATASEFTIYKKEGDGAWEKGAVFPTSRPGNILVDSAGVLHAFVFEPNDIAKNDSLGKLIHYWFPDSADGDIRNFEKEIVVDNDGSSETVNIRVGAAIGADDTMVAAFGLSAGNVEGKGHTEHVYSKKPADKTWKHSIAGVNLGHDWYYPYVLATDRGVHLLPVQDDFVAANDPNIYQKIMYFEGDGGSWERELIVDYTDHPLAASRRGLLEISDFYEDTDGGIHALYKEFLDPGEAGTVSSFKHLVKKNGSWGDQPVDLLETNPHLDWLRFVEIEGSLYYLAASYDEVFIGKVGGGELREIEIPIRVRGIYPYVAGKKGQAGADSNFVDVLLLSGDSSAYPDATNLYLRIPAAEFEKLN